MAIRKNHPKIAVSRQRSAVSFGYAKVRAGRLKRGDLFEIILIQIKGGGARRPKLDDIRRLRAVAKNYSSQPSARKGLQFRMV